MNGRRSNSGNVSAILSFFFATANTHKETQAAQGSKAKKLKEVRELTKNRPPAPNAIVK